MSSSSSLPPSPLCPMRWGFTVFPSFHGPDVRKGFLSHLHNHFGSKGITTFKDQEIERGHTIGRVLMKAIRESRVSIVLLSKNYASSSWCLDELVEILKCRQDQGQIVMTVFYEVDPSDVRKQRGDFGNAFEKTCQGKTEEMKQKWIEALSYVANIEGEHSLNWPNEAEMIKKICVNVSKKLHDFPGIVGLEAHLIKLDSKLCLEWDEVKMIGICGPRGIGKTTIARVLFKQLSTGFPFSCFMGNLKGVIGVDDDNDSKLRLQNLFLSRIFNQGDMRVSHLGAIKEWLKDQRVLIILDDVDDLEQLKILASELSWFGSGSRIIVTTEYENILKAHGVNDIYHVELPSEKEALEILCQSAFKQTSPWVCFDKLAKKIAKVCGYLPLSLRVVGASLWGEGEREWKHQLSRIKARKVEDVLRLGYDRLSKQNQALFLHIACFFNNEVLGNVKSIISDSNRLTGSDVRKGLKTLADKSLVHIYDGRIVMHYLLQQLGRQIVRKQSTEPGKRKFLEDAEEIHDVLANTTGTGTVIGISLDKSKVGNFYISHGAFDGMCNLQFLRIHGGKATTLQLSQISQNMKFPPHLSLFGQKFPPHLRLLDWDEYPRKWLHRTFQPEHLVELHMQRSNLKELWRGSKPLPNLKKIDMSYSSRLKAIPDLWNATNLETLTLTSCTNLVELPSSIKNLHKLKKLTMKGCRKLKVIPTNINLKSLEEVDMSDCLRLKTFPDISSTIKTLSVRDTKIKDVSLSISKCWSHLECLEIGNMRLKRLTHIPECVTSVDLSNSRTKRIPNCVRVLKQLVHLIVENCSKLESIPSLPSSLESLNANDCVSLKTVSRSFHKPIKLLTFYNCLKLDQESRRGITQQPFQEYICLPGQEIPQEFTHKAKGRSITISSGTFSRFKACLLLSPIKADGILPVSCSLRSKAGVIINSIFTSARLSNQSEHLFIFQGNKCCEGATSEILFEFSGCSNDDKIIECGVQILTDDAEDGSMNYNKVDNFATESSRSERGNSDSESSGSEEDNSEDESSGSEDDNSEDESSGSEVDAESSSSNLIDNFKADIKGRTLNWIHGFG